MKPVTVLIALIAVVLLHPPLATADAAISGAELPGEQKASYRDEVREGGKPASPASIIQRACEAAASTRKGDQLTAYGFRTSPTTSAMKSALP